MTKSKKSTPTLSKRVLSVDPGFDRLGFAVLEKVAGKETLLFSACVETDRKKPHGERLLEIGQALREAIEEWRPSDLAMEKLFFNQNVSTGIRVAEARGVAAYEAARAGMTLYEYGPQSIKVAVAGYGRADKKQVETMARRLVSIPLGEKKLDDEIDAIAVGITHLAHKKHI